MRLIETTHLKTWASSKPAESRFPYIVKSLICAVIEPDKLRMPSGDAVWVPGFDGVLLCAKENRFVPLGESVWELGTGSLPKKKANEDFAKRCRKPVHPSDGKKTRRSQVEVNRTEVTFVFVTPLVWVGKEVWVSERKKEGLWKDVVVIDGVDLQEWFEGAPAVNLQFAAELGLVPEQGLLTPDQAWEEWSQRTDPAASEELVVAGRGEQEKQFFGYLVASPSTFTVRGDSPQEAWGFALAALRKIESEEQRISLYSRVIVADNDEVAGRLRHLRNLIVILKRADNQVSGYLSSKGCHLVVPEGNDARAERDVIVLPRPTHRAFTNALSQMRLADAEAVRVARASGLSVTIFQRQRAKANYQRPIWADHPNITHLLPALLAGRWNRQSEADRAILCALAENPDYEAVEGNLQEFLLLDEPPLQQISEMWTLTAPVDAFQLIARRLTAAHLNRFKETFCEVFGRIDPKTEIPPEDWLLHDIRGERGHSGWLRSGMAEALLLIVERGRGARLTCVSSPQRYADGIIDGLPGLRNDWRLLASLRDQYPRLMEAAPIPLLDSLEHLLEAKPEDVRKLFVDEDAITGGSLHTGLLWGLETLAWGTEYLPKVSLVLAKLAKIDPGGQLTNRPINSLREIFLWWHPGTSAPNDQRLAALDLVITSEPETGWNILAKLLPKSMQSFSHTTAKPRWRDFGDLPQDWQDRQSQLRYRSAIVDRVLDRVGIESDRWRKVLRSLKNFSREQQLKAVALLEAISVGHNASESERVLLWEVLREVIYQHRTHSGTHWALPKEVLDALEAHLPKLAPDESAQRNRWLFDDWLPDLPEDTNDRESHERRVQGLREAAVREVLNKEGLSGLVGLATGSRYPGFVAQYAVPLLGGLEATNALIDCAVGEANAERLHFAGQVSGCACKLYGDKWRDLIRAGAENGKWPAEVAATLMLWWPDTRTLWREMDLLDEAISNEFWRRKPIHAIDGSLEDHIYQIDRLIAAGRASQVLDRIAIGDGSIPSETLLRIFDATFDQLHKAETVEEIRQLGLNPHDIRGFLKKIRDRTDIPREEIARREYQALPLLGHINAGGLIIHEIMAESPRFFVDVICDVFLPATRDKDEEPEPTPEAQSRARAAYSLLESMDRIPGKHGEGQIDEAQLREWIQAVRELAEISDRAAVADLQIGEILAQADADPTDGAWPHRAVRNIIESFAADDIRRGINVKRHNMRGAYSKALYEGGQQERTLAAQYRTWAGAARDGWPRMATVLDEIAQDWERQAEREDARAEQDKRE